MESDKIKRLRRAVGMTNPAFVSIIQSEMEHIGVDGGQFYYYLLEFIQAIYHSRNLKIRVPIAGFDNELYHKYPEIVRFLEGALENGQIKEDHLYRFFYLTCGNYIKLYEEEKMYDSYHFNNFEDKNEEVEVGTKALVVTRKNPYYYDGRELSEGEAFVERIRKDEFDKYKWARDHGIDLDRTVSEAEPSALLKLKAEVAESYKYCGCQVDGRDLTLNEAAFEKFASERFDEKKFVADLRLIHQDEYCWETREWIDPAYRRSA